MKLKIFILGVLFVSCGKSDYPVDDNVKFYNDNTFTFYDDLEFTYLDSEMLDDESLVIAGYTESKDQGMLYVDSSRTNISMQSIDNESNGLFNNLDILLTEKGYISHLGSSAKDNNSGEYDMILRKLNNNGVTIFKQKVDIDLNEIVIAHIQLPNEDFMILSLDNNQKRKYNIHKVTEEGEIIFSRSYQENRDITRFGKLKYSAEDSTIIIILHLENGSLHDTTVRLNKIDTDGNIIMTSDLISNRDIHLASVNMTFLKDGNILLFCSERTQVLGDNHMRIIKLNSNFIVIWDREYLDIEPNTISDVIESSDNKLLVLSFSRDIGEGEIDIISSRLDSEGEIVSRSVIGGNSSEIGHKIYEKQNGNIVIIGFQDNGFSTTTNFRFMTLETDSNGVPL